MGRTELCFGLREFFLMSSAAGFGAILGCDLSVLARILWYYSSFFFLFIVFLFLMINYMKFTLL
jgi:hypothetical protein